MGKYKNLHDYYYYDITNKLLTAGATFNLNYHNTSYNHMHQWEHICGKFYTSTLEAAFSRSKSLKTLAFDDFSVKQPRFSKS